MKTEEKKIRKILVGVDFSDPSMAALKEAVRLADQQRGEVKVAHIIDSEMMASLIEHTHLSREEVISSVESRLKCFCESAGAMPDQIKTELRVGHAVKEFGNLCDEFSPDLMVLGAWGSHAHPGLSTGATAKQIVQEVKTDVLLMRPRKNENFSNVVACIDFSAFDKPVIQAADQICLANKASLEILHVFFPPWKLKDVSQEDAGDFSEDFKQEFTALLRGRLDQLIPTNIHGVSSFETTTTVIETEAHSGGILDHLKKSGADVAVIGARGASRIESMILGRIAERVVTESASSVYVVKAPQG